MSTPALQLFQSHWPRAKRWRRPMLSGESLILVTSAWFVLACNGPFWGALVDRGVGPALQASLAFAIFGLHAILLGVVGVGRLLRPLLATLLIVTAIVSDAMQRYGVVFDVDMVRSVLQTDPAEVHEMFNLSIVVRTLLLGVLPAIAVFAVQPRRLDWRRSLRHRVLFLFAMLALTVAALAPVSQGVFALMRADPSLRYRITPGNYIVSAARALKQDEVARLGPPTPIATDARRPSTTRATRPRVLVLVIGETVRADHWGLNGYQRQTTPRLAARDDIINFSDVTACGTSTAVSLPCMFSIYGRARYDRTAIATHESLLALLARLGIKTLWRDNQAGCKGVCDGLEEESMPILHAEDPRCGQGRCLDETLLDGLAERIQATDQDQVIVLHQLGNHGPNYFERYPPEFARFQPPCQREELDQCSREEIINAYDNAILYTDTMLDRVIELLASDPSRDSAMLYVSDHGESLGEYGVYLHGAPWAVAPEAQIKVPMVVWLSPGLESDTGVDHACVRQHASEPRSHDDLFHTVIGLFDVSTSEYRATNDVLAACRTTRIHAPSSR